MEMIVARSRELLETMGPLSLGFCTSGQLFSQKALLRALNEPARACEGRAVQRAFVPEAEMK